MNLKDAVRRPKFDISKIDVNQPRFKKLVDEYVRWCKDQDYASCSRAEYESDILSCFNKFDLDGYHLAEHLKDTVWVEPDSTLVDILDGVFSVKDAINREVIKQWVKENFLTISENVIGKKVNAKVGIHNYVDHYITMIKHDTYEVCISTDISRKGGYVVGYENVTFVN